MRGQVGDLCPLEKILGAHGAPLMTALGHLSNILKNYWETVLKIFSINFQPILGKPIPLLCIIRSSILLISCRS